MTGTFTLHSLCNLSTVGPGREDMNGIIKFQDIRIEKGEAYLNYEQFIVYCKKKKKKHCPLAVMYREV